MDIMKKQLTIKSDDAYFTTTGKELYRIYFIASFLNCEKSVEPLLDVLKSDKNVYECSSAEFDELATLYVMLGFDTIKLHT